MSYTNIVSITTAPSSAWPDMPAKPISRLRLETYRTGIDIALRYFNSGHNSISEIVKEAGQWVSRYFGSNSPHLKRSLGLLDAHPHLFNLDVAGRLRLSTAQQLNPPVAYCYAADAPSNDSNNKTEPFPAYMEPTLATAVELRYIFYNNNTSSSNTNSPADTPVTAGDLYDSIVCGHLPAFLAHLATTDLELEKHIAQKLVSDPDRDALEEAKRHALMTSSSSSSLSSLRSLRLKSGSIVDLDALDALNALAAMQLPSPPSSFSAASSSSSLASSPPPSPRLTAPGSPGPIRLVLPPLRTPESPLSLGSDDDYDSSSSSTDDTDNRAGNRQLIKIKVPEHLRANRVAAKEAADAPRLLSPPIMPVQPSPSRILIKVPPHLRKTSPSKRRRSEDDDDKFARDKMPSKRIKLNARAAR